MIHKTPPLLPSRAKLKKTSATGRSYQASIRWPVDGRVRLSGVLGTTASIDARLPPWPRIACIQVSELEVGPSMPRDVGTDG